jgi:hypothetical protein
MFRAMRSRFDEETGGRFGGLAGVDKFAAKANKQDRGSDG